MNSVKKCFVVNKEMQAANTELRNTILNAVTNYIGPPGNHKGDKVHEELHDTLSSWLQNNYYVPSLAAGVQINRALANIREGYKEMFNRDVFTPEYLYNSASLSTAVLNRTKKMLYTLDKLAEENITNKVRSFSFPYTIAFKYDKTGLMGKAMADFQDFSDVSIQKFISEKTNIDEAHARWSSHLDTMLKGKRLTGLLFEPIDRWGNGRLIQYAADKKLPDSAQRRVRIHDIIYPESKSATSPTHVLVSDAPSEKAGVESGTWSKVKKIPITALDFNNEFQDEMQQLIHRQYGNILKERLQRGQTRFFDYGRTSKGALTTLSERELKEVDITLFELTQKQLRGDKSGRVFTKELKNGDKIVYTMVKSEEQKRSKEGIGMREKYRIIPISYETNQWAGERKKAKSNWYFFKEDTDRMRYDLEEEHIPKFKAAIIALEKEMPKGFYNSPREEVFGLQLGGAGQELNSFEKQYVDFKKINVNEDILGYGQRDGLWNTIADVRAEYAKIGTKVKNEVKRNNAALQVLFANFKKFPILEEQFQQLLNLYSIHNKSWQTKDGTVHTLNTEFYMKKENYAPIMFDKETYEKFIKAAMADLENKMSINEDNEEVYERYKASYDNMKEQYEAHKTGYNTKTIEERDVYTKHRKPYTDSGKARNDANIHTEYLTRQGNILSKNENMITLLRTIFNLQKMYKGEALNSRISFLINEYMIMASDPKAEQHFFNSEIGYEAAAKKWNKWMKPFQSEQLTAKGMEDMSKRTSGTISSSLLGWSGASANRFQSVNGVIYYGAKIFFDARKILNSDNPDTKKEWDKIIAASGIRNVIEMFHEMFFLSGGDKSEIMAEGPGIAIGFPIKSFKEFMTLRKLGKAKFIKKISEAKEGDAKAIKDMLTNWEKRRVDYQNTIGAKKAAKFAKKFDKLKKYQKSAGSEIEVRNLEYLLNLYYDILFTDPKGKDAKEIIANTEAKIKEFMPNIINEKLRAMVTWKLSSFGGESFLKKWFTFSGSEQAVRDEIYVMALLDAKNRGLITDYKSKEAIRIGRNAVYSFAFGMTAIWLPEVLGGVGKNMFQYRGYMVQETKLELETLRNFMNSGEHKGTRLLKAIGRMFTTSKKQPWEEDTEADIAARMLAVRMTAVGVSIMKEMVSLPWVFKYVPWAKDWRALTNAPIRGLESPVTMAFGRILLRSLAFILAGDNDDDDIYRYVKNWMYLVFPPMFTLLFFNYLTSTIAGIIDD